MKHWFHAGIKRRVRRKILAKRYGYMCLRCRLDFPLKKLTLDHIKPRSFGGTYNMNNLQLLCGPCNGDKGQNEIDYRPSKRTLRRRARQA